MANLAFAKCVKPCPYAYGGCSGYGVHIKPSIIKHNPQYLQSEDGNLFCFNGKFLGEQDMICENCGVEFEPLRNEVTEEYLTYICPSCDKKVKTTY